VDTLLLVLPAMAGLVSSMIFHSERLAAGAAAGHALATDVAEFLVRRGVPFREAHEAVGHLVVWCQVNDCELGDVSDEDMHKVSPHLTPEVRSVLSVRGAIAARDGFGGTSPRRVAEQLAALRQRVSGDAAWAAR
jgi:argininosuccinate lyase